MNCKSCDAEFEVCRDNEFDPDSPEFPEESPVEEEESDISWRQLAANTVGGLCVVAGLATMLALVFINPRVNTVTAQSTLSQPSSSASRGPQSAGNSSSIAQNSPAQNPPSQNAPGSFNFEAAKTGDQVPLPNSVPNPSARQLPGNPDFSSPPFFSGPPNTPPFDFGPPSRMMGPNNSGPSDLHAKMREMRDRVQRMQPPRSLSGPPGRVGPQVRNFNYDGPSAIPSSNRPVTDISQLKVGQILQVEWKQQWWPAEIVAILPNQMVQIRYRGWQQSEEVPVNRLQLAHE